MNLSQHVYQFPASLTCYKEVTDICSSELCILFVIWVKSICTANCRNLKTTSWIHVLFLNENCWVFVKYV